MSTTSVGVASCSLYDYKNNNEGFEQTLNVNDFFNKDDQNKILEKPQNFIDAKLALNNWLTDPDDSTKKIVEELNIILDKNNAGFYIGIWKVIEVKMDSAQTEDRLTGKMIIRPIDTKIDNKLTTFTGGINLAIKIDQQSLNTIANVRLDSNITIPKDKELTSKYDDQIFQEKSVKFYDIIDKAIHDKWLLNPIKEVDYKVQVISFAYWIKEEPIIIIELRSNGKAVTPSMPNAMFRESSIRIWLILKYSNILIT